jgi:hypothetical protein
MGGKTKKNLETPKTKIATLKAKSPILKENDEIKLKKKKRGSKTLPYLTTIKKFQKANNNFAITEEGKKILNDVIKNLVSETCKSTINICEQGVTIKPSHAICGPLYFAVDRCKNDYTEMFNLMKDGFVDSKKQIELHYKKEKKEKQNKE